MLTVKKFGAVFNLPIGGYAAGVVGLLLALLTILVFPPDMDLQGKFCQRQMIRAPKLKISFLLLDDIVEANSTSHIIETTVSTILDTTHDPDEHDDDEPIPESEKHDEINDSKKFAKIFTTNFPTTASY